MTSSSHPHFSKAPIVEALLDIQVRLPDRFAVDALLGCQKRVQKDYPQRARLQQHEGTMQFGKKVTASATSEDTGFVFRSPDKKRQFQTKTNGFTFNQLAPYPGWEVFFKEAKRLWDEYKKVAVPVECKRIALRFINRFDLPGSLVRLEDYFRTYVAVSDDLPQLLEAWFFQVQLAIPEINAVVAITQTQAPPADEEHVSVILDLDLFRTESLPTGNEIWDLFKEFRDWKNKVFLDCLTEKAKELIR